MAAKPYNPLTTIPSPEAVRRRLEETLTLARQLRILLRLSERLQQADARRREVSPCRT